MIEMPPSPLDGGISARLTTVFPRRRAFFIAPRTRDSRICAFFLKKHLTVNQVHPLY